MLCRISVLGDAAPSDMLRHMLKPSNGGRLESSLTPWKVNKLDSVNSRFVDNSLKPREEGLPYKNDGGARRTF